MIRDSANKRRAVKAILDDFSATVTLEDAREIVDLVRPFLGAALQQPPSEVGELAQDYETPTEALEEINDALTAWDTGEPFQDPGERHNEPYEQDAQFVTFMGYTARRALESATGAEQTTLSTSDRERLWEQFLDQVEERLNGMIERQTLNSRDCGPVIPVTSLEYALEALRDDALAGASDTGADHAE